MWPESGVGGEVGAVPEDVEGSESSHSSCDPMQASMESLRDLNVRMAVRDERVVSARSLQGLATPRGLAGKATTNQRQPRRRATALSARSSINLAGQAPTTAHHAEASARNHRCHVIPPGRDEEEPVRASQIPTRSSSRRLRSPCRRSGWTGASPAGPTGRRRPGRPARATSRGRGRGTDRRRGRAGCGAARATRRRGRTR